MKKNKVLPLPADIVNLFYDKEGHEKLHEEIREAMPMQSCEKVRAWMKLNIESSMTPVWNN